MKPSKSVRLFAILILALGLFVLARIPARASHSTSGSAPRVAAYMLPGGFPQPLVNWNS